MAFLDSAAAAAATEGGSGLRGEGGRWLAVQFCLGRGGSTPSFWLSSWSVDLLEGEKQEGRSNPERET